MAKRKKQRRAREKAPTVDYVDPEGNVLTLRQTLSAGDDRQARRGAGRARRPRRTTPGSGAPRPLFERLAVRWEIAGLPLDDQKMLLGRYRMADAETQRWVRQTIAEHLERHIPELSG